MTLKDLGYNIEFENYRKDQSLDSFGVGRVISEHKERYVVKTTENEYDAEIIGNLRFSAVTRSDFPAVGDWVAISEYDENKVLIHSVFPRKVYFLTFTPFSQVCSLSKSFIRFSIHSGVSFSISDFLHPDRLRNAIANIKKIDCFIIFSF